VTIGGALSSGSGTVDIDSGAALNLDAGISTSVDVALESDGALKMDNGALIDVGSSKIALTSGGDMTLGGLKTTNNSTTAVVLDSNGSIKDGGDSYLEVDAANGTLKMTAVGGIGTKADPLEVKVAKLDVFSSGAGDISLNESDTVTLVSLSNQSGLINVTAGGNMTVNDTTVTTEGGTDSDDIFLTTTAGDMVFGSVTANGRGDVILEAAGTINGGRITADEARITATTIGLTTPPEANVSNFFILLSQKNEINLSGDLVEGPKLTDFPPQGNVSAPGVVRLLPSGYTYGIGLIGAPILVPTATGQQIRLEQELRRASQADFFREEPVIIEVAVADLVEDCTNRIDDDEDGDIDCQDSDCFDHADCTMGEAPLPIETQD
jgi:hypothetical protein